MLKPTVVIVDFTHVYYKAKSRIITRRMGNTENIDRNKVGKEAVLIFNAMRERFDSLLNSRSQIATKYIVCFDSYKETDGTEKQVILTHQDYKQMDSLIEHFKNYEYECYQGYVDGEVRIKADDIIAALVIRESSLDNEVVIISPDSDMLSLISDNISVWVVSHTSPYTLVTKEMYQWFVARKLRVAYLPYNAIALYKCMVGDTSDKISGIKGFGSVAFTKFVKKLGAEGWTDWHDVEKTLEYGRQNGLSDEEVEMALQSWEEVRFKTVDLRNCLR